MLCVTALSESFTQSYYSIKPEVFDLMATEVVKGRSCEKLLIKADSVILSKDGTLVQLSNLLNTKDSQLSNAQEIKNYFAQENDLLLQQSKSDLQKSKEETQKEHGKVKRKNWKIAGLVFLNVLKDVTIILLL